ncbi:acyl carrier protein [Paucibacter sp. B2R-40]|uniref:acyl carrier protein n=1 Tax=Paucibacter sp. B2R-40 TaxID=2893554 RepID=UPI002962133F|nr:phosphopantetheine-binding protein [Paucibacter sp. B2R-40]
MAWLALFAKPSVSRLTPGFRAIYMDTQRQVLRILDEVLSLDGRSAAFERGTHLLGAIPELDSMAVVSLITSLEEQLGIIVDDDEIDGETFSTVGSLTDFVAAKLAD